MPRIVGLLESLMWMIFDTNIINQNTSTYTYFANSNIIGSSFGFGGLARTQADTNMDGIFDYPNSFTVRTIRSWPAAGTTVATAAITYDHSEGNFIVGGAGGGSGGKSYARMPMQMYTTGFGLHGVVAHPGTTPTVSIVNGETTPNALWTIGDPIDLIPQQPAVFVQTFEQINPAFPGPPIPPTKFHIGMDGIWRRAVQ